MGETTFYFDEISDFRQPPDKWTAACKRCGEDGLKWRLTDDGNWALFENERIEHNRLKPHNCRSECSADDFDAL